MNIAIQVAAFGLIKRSLTFNNNKYLMACTHVMWYFHFILRLLRLFFMLLRHFASA